MLVVNTKLGISTIHGIGLFADQHIKKGTIVWKWNPIIDYKITSKQFKSLPLVAQKTVLNYCYSNHDGDYIICGDDGRFFNHAKEPNCFEVDSDDGKEPTIAIRNIRKGEELTINYYQFDTNYKNGKKKL
jgi:SET domain-containing protein